MPVVVEVIKLKSRRLHHDKRLVSTVLVVIALAWIFYITTPMSPPPIWGETTVGKKSIRSAKNKNDDDDSNSNNIMAAVMNELHAENSATGVLFSGKAFRAFAGTRRFMPGWEEQENNNEQVGNVDQAHEQEQCDQWAVVTTISAPTEAIILVAELPGWCTVVVADTKTPVDFVERANLASSAKMHFLSVEDQEKWAKQNGGAIADFVRSIPYKHFARKNIGYLYAIQHGAKFIFDFDDDNLLLPNHYVSDDDVNNNNTLDPIANRTHLEDVQVPILGTTVFNHHELMKATIAGSWARGFPLEQLQDDETSGMEGYVEEAIPMEKIAVMQFCAQGDPDIDAVHRLVKPLPMNYAEDTRPLLVPSHAFAPYNAQASIHTPAALWATFLPYSVSGRVTDIWRGYFAEAIFRDLGISVAFLPPKVRHDRNQHNYLADMQAELDLYFKTGKLIKFLSEEWLSMADTVPERMEQLWIELYERGYIEIADVWAVQLWLEALVQSNYVFPKVTRRRYDNVVLMGQFNYANSADSVVFWVQKWREVFGHVIVRGPFNETELSVLHSRGIKAVWGQDDYGYYSPIENLLSSLMEYKNTPGIDGVLYLHDDALLDIMEMTGSQYPFPAKRIIASRRPNGGFPFSYHDHRTIDVQALALYSYRILPDGTYIATNGTKYTEWQELEESMLSSSEWHSQCIPALTKVSADARSATYKLPDGTFLAPSQAQADMLFVPIMLADEYIKAAQLMLEYNVFLECGIPTIVQMLQIAANASVATVGLCTSWNDSRGTEMMIDSCLSNLTTYGMFHPYKLLNGLAAWSRQFDTVIAHGSTAPQQEGSF